MPSTSAHETLRCSFTLQGDRLFLIYDAMRQLYRLATRWCWLTSFAKIEDAGIAFDALELVDGNIHQAARLAKKEIKLMARDTTCHIYTAMTPVWRLIERIERCLISETGVHATASNQGE